MRAITLAASAFVLSACAAHDAESATSEPSPKLTDATERDESLPTIKLGNGENNYVVTEGATREGATFTFSKVAIDKPGFLVIHPFKDGKPAQTVYSGAAPLTAGVHENASVTIDYEPASGEMFVVMLHYDMNEDGVFDFNDGVTVPDAPVFEGDTLVALRIAAP